MLCFYRLSMDAVALPKQDMDLNSPLFSPVKNAPKVLNSYDCAQ